MGSPLCLCPVSNSVRSLREMGFVSYVSDDGVGDGVPVGPAVRISRPLFETKFETFQTGHPRVYIQL